MNLIDKLKATKESCTFKGYHPYKEGLKKAINIVEAHDFWISTKIKPPMIEGEEQSDEVLVKLDSGSYAIGGYINGWYVNDDRYVMDKVIAWMPIPKTTKP